MTTRRWEVVVTDILCLIHFGGATDDIRLELSVLNEMERNYIVITTATIPLKIRQEIYLLVPERKNVRLATMP